MAKRTTLYDEYESRTKSIGKKLRNWKWTRNGEKVRENEGKMNWEKENLKERKWKLRKLNLLWCHIMKHRKDKENLLKTLIYWSKLRCYKWKITF